jgi:hypothetical protein
MSPNIKGKGRVAGRFAPAAKPVFQSGIAAHFGRRALGPAHRAPRQEKICGENRQSCRDDRQTRPGQHIMAIPTSTTVSPSRAMTNFFT